MNRKTTTLTAAVFAAAFAIAPAAAQNLPPPGNVNPGSLNSGAEESGAPNQQRSYEVYGARRIYNGGYGAYATPYNMGPARPGGANAIGADE
jgi:hypothetical protein